MHEKPREDRRLERIQQLAREEVGEEERETARKLCREHRVALFVVAYNAERHLRSVISRIPEDLLPLFAEVFIIDDSSSDATEEEARRAGLQHPEARIRVYRTPFNRGYGGNQKLGYLYSIRRGFEYVVLLHGDGQYAPELLHRILAAAPGADAVLASRMLSRREALRGGMPLHKWIGNQVLTRLGNRILGTSFSEFHTGYRAYRVAALEAVPFTANTDDFHFDGEILAQGATARWRFVEVPVPTYYGDEVCHVPGLRYAWGFLVSLLRSRLARLGIYYRRNYDIELFGEDAYSFKRSPWSLHQWVLSRVPLEEMESSVELGAHHGDLSAIVADRVARHVAVDVEAPDRAGASEALALDLERPFSQRLPGRPYDLCLALDVTEHLASPETFMQEVFSILRPHALLVASTANVAYLPIRLGLLLGQFNYGKRGVLDMTHKRLFTIRSFKRLLNDSGFQVERVVGFPPPLTDMIADTAVLRFLERTHAALARIWPTMFAFNFALAARRMDDVEDILARTTALFPGEETEASG
ncbi:MAG: glycosyltransferase [Acidobacteria bacterium]|nr:glycosyltransferase [Acidobacteriota bacterium]